VQCITILIGCSNNIVAFLEFLTILEKQALRLGIKELVLHTSNFLQISAILEDKTDIINFLESEACRNIDFCKHLRAGSKPGKVVHTASDWILLIKALRN
jgi:hypothetical protein